MNLTKSIAFQFEVASTLLDHHLSGLTEDDLSWTAAPLHWTMRRDAAGVWQPDWADAEPDPVPAPTVGWLTWHLTWWWSVTVADVRGEPVPGRDQVGWEPSPDRIRSRIGDLRTTWVEILDHLTADDLAAPSGFPWPADAGRDRADQLAWFGVEYTKNVSEIGQLMLLRRAIQHDAS